MRQYEVTPGTSWPARAAIDEVVGGFAEQNAQMLPDRLAHPVAGARRDIVALKPVPRW